MAPFWEHSCVVGLDVCWCLGFLVGEQCVFHLVSGFVFGHSFIA